MSLELKGVSSMATRQILGILANRYGEKTGIRAEIAAMGGVDAAQLVRSGAKTDIVVLASNVMAELEAEGHLLSGSTVGIARSEIALAVPKGGHAPDITDVASIRSAVTQADKICYSTGPSGNHVLKLFEDWGIARDDAERLIKAPPGVPVGELLARGKAAMGFQQLSELMNVSDITVVGVLPTAIQSTTIFAAGISTTSENADEVRTLISYFVSTAADAVKRDCGMGPA